MWPVLGKRVPFAAGKSHSTEAFGKLTFEGIAEEVGCITNHPDDPDFQLCWINQQVCPVASRSPFWNSRRKTWQESGKLIGKSVSIKIRFSLYNKLFKFILFMILYSIKIRYKEVVTQRKQFDLLFGCKSSLNKEGGGWLGRYYWIIFTGRYVSWEKGFCKGRFSKKGCNF